MNPTEAQQRLDEYANRERRIQLRFVAPLMLFCALFAFAALGIGGLGTWQTNVLGVNWNPHDVPQAPLVGAVLAAAPFLLLARFYRP